MTVFLTDSHYRPTIGGAENAGLENDGLEFAELEI